MSITFNVDPLTASLIAIGIPIAYKILSSLEKRLSRVEDFLSIQYGDKKEPFKP
jgi:hypothetical protein